MKLRKAFSSFKNHIDDRRLSLTTLLSSHLSLGCRCHKDRPLAHTKAKGQSGRNDVSFTMYAFAMFFNDERSRVCSLSRTFRDYCKFARASSAEVV